jgi:hypothetical protein
MTKRRRSNTHRKRRLERLQRDYDQLKQQLTDVGFICEGSLTELYTSCGNPNCRCRDPEKRHGPYWQLTWKQSGKTTTRRLSADEAQLYRQWIANRRQLKAIIEQMQRLSRQASEYILAELGRPFHGPEHPARPADKPRQAKRQTQAKPRDIAITRGFSVPRSPTQPPKAPHLRAVSRRPKVAAPK